LCKFGSDLAADFKAFVLQCRKEWLKTNPCPIPYAWNPNAWFDRMADRGQGWIEFVTPKAEAWLKARGFRLGETPKTGDWYAYPMETDNEPSSSGALPSLQ